MIVRLVTAVLALIGISGCTAFEPFVRYERPKLFHPATARVAEALKAAGNVDQTRFLLQQTNEAVARDAPELNLRLEDVCASGSPTITVSPRTALVRVDGSSPNYLIRLNPSAVPVEGNAILVEARSCRAPHLSVDQAESSGLLQRARVRVGTPQRVLNVIHPPAILAGLESTDHEIRVMDKCVNKEPQITAYPPTALTGPFKADKVPDWYGTSISLAKQAGFIGDVELVIRTCGDDGAQRRIRIPVGYKQLSTTFNVWANDDVAEEFGHEFARTFLVADVVFENPNSRPILVYGSSLRARVRFLAAEQDIRTTFGAAAIEHPSRLDTVYWGDRPASEALDFKDYYRPLAYSDVLAIFTNRQESDPRQRTLSALESLGEVAAAAAVFVTAVDYAKGVSLFTGVVLPELEKQLLWDVILHLKNIEQRSLKEVEEIPEHGQLRRAVFFPKRALLAIVPPFPMYVAEIRPDEAPVTAVLIDKKATVSSQ